VAYASDREDGTVRVGAQQVITREVEAPERNARPRTCFDVATQDLALLFREEEIRKNLKEFGVDV
jgi:hypothetical protein